MEEGSYSVKDGGNHIIVEEYTDRAKSLFGVFSTKGISSIVPVDIPDGVYTNLLNNQEIYVESGFACNEGKPQIFEVSRRTVHEE